LLRFVKDFLKRFYVPSPSSVGYRSRTRKAQNSEVQWKATAASVEVPGHPTSQGAAPGTATPILRILPGADLLGLAVPLVIWIPEGIKSMTITMIVVVTMKWVRHLIRIHDNMTTIQGVDSIKVDIRPAIPSIHRAHMSMTMTAGNRRIGSIVEEECVATNIALKRAMLGITEGTNLAVSRAAEYPKGTFLLSPEDILYEPFLGLGHRQVYEKNQAEGIGLVLHQVDGKNQTGGNRLVKLEQVMVCRT
jgi:hypothetical protein